MKWNFCPSHYDTQTQEVSFGFGTNRRIVYTERVYSSCLQAITIVSHYRTGMIQIFFCTCCHQATQSHAPFTLLFLGLTKTSNSLSSNCSIYFKSGLSPHSLVKMLSILSPFSFPIIEMFLLPRCMSPCMA